MSKDAIPFQYTEEFQILKRLQDEAAKNPWASNPTEAARRTGMPRTRIEKLVGLHPYLKTETGIDLISLEKVARELYDKKSKLDDELDDKDFKELRCEEIKIGIKRETLKLHKEVGKLIDIEDHERTFVKYAQILNGALDMLVAEISLISRDPEVANAAKRVRDRVKEQLVEEIKSIEAAKQESETALDNTGDNEEKTKE